MANNQSINKALRRSATRDAKRRPKMKVSGKSVFTLNRLKSGRK